MTEAVLALVPLYGLGLIAGATFLSCLALPMPASLVMLSAGGFAAAGDLVLWQTVLAAWLGAIMGDQLGYVLGRIGGRLMVGRAIPPRQAALMGKAMQALQDKGDWAVFFSRWLVSPLGPYVNFAGGAWRLNWGRFTRAGIAGEAIWVALYVGLGAAFANDIVALAGVLGSASGLLAALAVAAALGIWLRMALRHRAQP